MKQLKHMQGIYRNASLFIIADGPSFASVDKSLLSRPGVVTMGLNNSPKSYRPDLWCCMDNPETFLESIWADPRIVKFVPEGRTRSVVLGKPIASLPAVVPFKASLGFNADSYLAEQTVNYGSEAKDGGARSVLLAALKIAYVLGFRRVYLLGVDFRMEKGAQNYHFDQATSDHAVDSNNQAYEILAQRFAELLPHFDAAGFQVFNCNPKSSLEVFPKIDLAAAVEEAAKPIPEPAEESTAGRYDRTDRSRPQKLPPEHWMKMRAEKQILVGGISRSGLHAILDWIGSQFSGRVEFRNNLSFRPEHFLHYPDVLGVRDWYTLPSVPLGDRTQPIRLALYGYENRPADTLEYHKAIESEDRIRAIVVRDPRNVLASLAQSAQAGNKRVPPIVKISQGIIEPTSLDALLERWERHANMVIDPPSDLVPIIYDRWLDDQCYRDSIAQRLGVDQRSDASMAIIPENGNGSSFDGLDIDAQALREKVRNRWKVFAGEPWYESALARNPKAMQLWESLVPDRKDL